MDDLALKEKRSIALTSVFAAIFLTGFKLVIGLMTGSLGILSEALHSGLDLVAAGITFFAVKYGDKPADHDHHFGHSKIESFSALVETLLLVITCIWIVYEASKRLITGSVELELNVWAFIVILTSIVVDYSRSKALMRVARKYKSEALEADALHFSTDILSSSVVLIGLVGVYFNFHYADPIAALIVAVIVLYISYKLGKRSFDVLTDRAPQGTYEEVLSVMKSFPAVLDAHDIRIRQAGPVTFVEMNIHVEKNISIKAAHEITSSVEDAIVLKIPRAKVLIHTEPDGEE